MINYVNLKHFTQLSLYSTLRKQCIKNKIYTTFANGIPRVVSELVCHLSMKKISVLYR